MDGRVIGLGFGHLVQDRDIICIDVLDALAAAAILLLGLDSNGCYRCVRNL
jgi:hypothetical protein